MSDNTPANVEELIEQLPTSKSNRRTYLLALLYPVSALLIGLVLLWPGTSLADPNASYTFTVTNTNDSGAGSLRQAMSDADVMGWASTNRSVPQYIVFNLPTLPATVNLVSPLPIISPTVVITGPVSATGGVTVDAGGQFRVFFIEGYGNGRKGNLTLVNLTIANGYDNFGGGGIFNHGGRINLFNCTVRDNRAEARGAGIFNDLGYTYMYNTTVYSNAILHARGGTGAEGGGGLYNHPNWTQAANGTDYPSIITLVNSSFISNIVIPRVITDGGNGGGVFNDGGTVNLRNTVVANNSAPGGHGPDFRNAAASLGNNFIGNGRVAGGDGAESNGWVASDQVGSNANPLNPLVGAFANNGGPNFTLMPLKGSPLIDAGNSTPVIITLTTDQRGLPRTKDGNGDGTAQMDIGATEAQLQIVLDNSLTNYVANAPPVLINPNATVIDPTSLNTSWVNRTISATITNNGTADDLLGVNNQGDNPGQIGVAGNVVKYGGAPIATLAGGSGTSSPLQITFTSDSTTIPMVQALLTNITFSTSNVGAGNRSVQFVLNTPNGNSSVPVSNRVAVAIASSTTSLVSAPNPSQTGQAVTFTATVSPVAPATGVPTGTVSLKNGNSVVDTQPLNGGNAVFSVPFTQTGAITLTALYNGNAGFTPSTSAGLVQTVICAYQVTLPTDDGQGNTCGTLSYALNQAVSETVPVTITLPAGPITFTGPMPQVTPAAGGYLTIAGPCSTAANGYGTPGAGLQAGIGASSVGITLTNNMALTGVVMTGFSNYAVVMSGDNNQLSCSWLGTTDGITATPNGNGLYLIGSHNGLGKAAQPASGNLIAGNTGIGLKIDAPSQANGLFYNWFGLQKDGASRLPNVGGNIAMSPGSQLLYRTGNIIKV